MELSRSAYSKIPNFYIEIGTQWYSFELNTIAKITEDTIYYVKGETEAEQEASVLYDLPNTKEIHDLIYQN